MNPEQILLFETSHTKGRANNDTNNTAREKILEAIVNPPEDCLNEPEYGGKWRTLYAKFDEKIREMTTTMFDRYIIGHAPSGRIYYNVKSSKINM